MMKRKTNKKKNKIVSILVAVVLIFVLANLDKTGTFSVVAPPSDGLVAYWDFQGGSVGAGTNNGAIVTTGIVGDGMGFDGTGYIDAGNNLDMGISDFTLSAWIKVPLGDIEDRFIIHTKQGACGDISPGYGIAIENEGLIFAYFGDGTNTACKSFGNSNGKDGQWHHLAISFDRINGVSKAYFDGVKFGTDWDISGVTNSTGSTRELLID